MKKIILLIVLLVLIAGCRKTEISDYSFNGIEDINCIGEHSEVVIIGKYIITEDLRCCCSHDCMTKSSVCVCEEVNK